MKNIILIILTLITSTTYSQKSIIIRQKIDHKKLKEEVNDNISLNFSPRNLIKQIGFLPKIYLGKQAMEFSLRTKRLDNPPSIDPTIIILKSKTNSIVINKPIRDTIYFLMDGSLSLNTIHYLDKKELDFIRKEKINKIILLVNGSSLELNLTKKSQGLFRENFSYL